MKWIKHYLILISFTFSATSLGSVGDGWLIVVNADADIGQLSKKQVISLFLGRAKFLPSGEKAQALDFPIESTSRASFYHALTGKNIADIDAYWARLKYSGKASPPTPVDTDEQIIDVVSKVSAAIAYLPSAREDELQQMGLKTVLSMSAE